MFCGADMDTADAQKIQVAKGVIPLGLLFQTLIAVAVAFDFDAEKTVRQDSDIGAIAEAVAARILAARRTLR